MVGGSKREDTCAHVLCDLDNVLAQAKVPELDGCWSKVRVVPKDGIRPHHRHNRRHNIGKRTAIRFAVRTRHLEKDTRSGVIVARRGAEHIDGTYTEKVPRTEVKVHLRRAAEAAVGVPGGVVLLGRARLPGLVEAATVATEPGRGPHHLS